MTPIATATTPRPSTARQTSAGLGPAVARVTVGLVLGFVVTVGVGKLSLLGSVKTVDEAAFLSVVESLQSVPGLTGFSEVLTDLGAIPINVGMALGLALMAGLQRPSSRLGVLVVAALFSALVFQNLTNRVVDGFAPTEFVIGDAGPYFSGGVVRVILLTGMAATLALPRERGRWVWRLAIAMGMLEATTRLVLGRHWPFDLLAAFPVGLAFLWGFRHLALRLTPTDRSVEIETVEPLG